MTRERLELLQQQIVYTLECMPDIRRDSTFGPVTGMLQGCVTVTMALGYAECMANGADHFKARSC
jgi:hypothetical protein